MERVLVPHAEINYDERYHIDHFKGFDWRNPKKPDGSPMTPYELKCAAVHFARANGFKETGMSVNEIALMYDLLEQKKPKYVVELGRNYGCSTRLFIPHVIRHGGNFDSWDLKHWDGFIETMGAAGYCFKIYNEKVAGRQETAYGPLELEDGTKSSIRLLVRDSVKSDIVPPDPRNDRFVDFLLIDTEHGLEHALGEYMRWRNFLNSGALVAFHDSTLPGPKRAIEIIKEVEEMAAPGAGRFVREYENERVDGYGIHVLEMKG